MKKVRLYNLTDVGTPELKASGQENITVAGRDFSIPPGEFREVWVTPYNQSVIQHAVSAGLLAMDVLPTEYLVKKEKMSKSVRVEQEKKTKKAGKGSKK